MAQKQCWHPGSAHRGILSNSEGNKYRWGLLYLYCFIDTVGFP
ncbi:hypothetical protein D083_2918 [Dickeya solani RNS 08.23.3.1.A]|nr:hypothetical protein D083_2918 [Dickeya solani RNS 08.23.3.1.A]